MGKAHKTQVRVSFENICSVNRQFGILAVKQSLISYIG